MLKGDLSNDMPGRVLVVANDFLIKFPHGRAAFTSGKMFGRRRAAVDRLEVDSAVRAWMHDYTWRRQLRVDVVIIGMMDEQWAKAVQDRFDRLNLSVASVYSVADVQELVRALAYMPEVVAVVHGKPEWGLAFGPRGICGAENL